MTDAEKMREAAAQIVDEIRLSLRLAMGVAMAAGAKNTTSHGYMQIFLDRSEAAAAKIRALPIPDASAPVADCQQAGLVTVDAGLLDEVKAELACQIERSVKDHSRNFPHDDYKAANIALGGLRSVASIVAPETASLGNDDAARTLRAATKVKRGE